MAAQGAAFLCPGGTEAARLSRSASIRFASPDGVVGLPAFELRVSRQSDDSGWPRAQDPCPRRWACRSRWRCCGAPYFASSTHAPSLSLAQSCIAAGNGWRREPLAEGLDLAYRCGAAGVVSQAMEELRAAGARPRRTVREGPDALTATESRMAVLAASGRSNREIAQELCVTLKTVEGTLMRAYAKLGISGAGLGLRSQRRSGPLYVEVGGKVEVRLRSEARVDGRESPACVQVRAPAGTAHDPGAHPPHSSPLPRRALRSEASLVFGSFPGE